MIYLFAGRSGSGKTTQANILKKQPNFYKITTYTTRGKRKGEIENVDYHFISKEDFFNLKEENFFIGAAEFAGNYYGISKKDLEKYANSSKNIILVLELEGIKEIKKNFKNAICIYLYLKEEEMVKRMKARGDSDEKIKNRLANLQDFAPYSDYIIDASKGVDEIAKEIMDIVCKLSIKS
ncbi:guanylate kinase [Peptoniphilus sp. ING2-D1G]|nr:guanylate kinase [Peptoniphilus sp. ING2-D1G]